MELIQVNGAGLEIQRIPGRGGRPPAPLIFLHEGLGSVAMWRDWPAQVCAATGRAAIVYSRRGYGQSEGIPDVRGRGRLGPDYMHREALEVLPELSAALDLDAPILVGHSDGATIALVHAGHFTVTGCVVMAPHVIVEDQSIRAIEEARAAYESGALRQRLQRYHRDVDCAFWQWNDIWLDPAFRNFDIRSECRRIDAPLLALQGDADPYGTLRQVEEIEPTRGPFTRHVLSACGHSPHRDQPDATLRHITKFLEQLP